MFKFVVILTGQIKKIIIDGDNIAHNYKNVKNRPKLSNLFLAINWANSINIDHILIISGYLISKIDDRQGLEDLIRSGNAFQVPKDMHDDEIIILASLNENAYILSNDFYREYFQYYDPVWIKERRIPYTIIRDLFYINRMSTFMTQDKNSYSEISFLIEGAK